MMAPKPRSVLNTNNILPIVVLNKIEKNKRRSTLRHTITQGNYVNRQGLIKNLFQEQESNLLKVQQSYIQILQDITTSPPLVTHSPPDEKRYGLFDGKENMMMHSLQLLLNSQLPSTASLGTAVRTKDGLFDALAQALTAKPSKASCQYNIGQLRLMCYYTLLGLDCNYPDPRDPAHWVFAYKHENWVAYEVYKSHIQYTALECATNPKLSNTTAIGGDIMLEGRMLAQRLNTSIHVIELQTLVEEISGCNLVEPKHLLIKPDLSVVTLETSFVNYQDPAMIHIAKFDDHYIPIFVPIETPQFELGFTAYRSQVTQLREGRPAEIQYAKVCSQSMLADTAIARVREKPVDAMMPGCESMVFGMGQ